MDETWQDVVGFEGHYQVSDYGRVRSFVAARNRWIKDRLTEEPRILKPQKWRKGYLKVRLGKCEGVNPNSDNSAFFVHRLTWIAFNGDIPDRLTINHKDCNKANNHLDNLELATPLEQYHHARAIGIKRRYKGRLCAILKADDVREIRRLRAEGVILKNIADKFGTGQSNIRWILLGKTWRHV